MFEYLGRWWYTERGKYWVKKNNKARGWVVYRPSFDSNITDNSLTEAEVEKLRLFVLTDNKNNLMSNYLIPFWYKNPWLLCNNLNSKTSHVFILASIPAFSFKSLVKQYVGYYHKTIQILQLFSLFWPLKQIQRNSEGAWINHTWSSYG